MEDFYIFTVNDTTDSSLEEYNSEVDLENEETNVFFKNSKYLFAKIFS